MERTPSCTVALMALLAPTVCADLLVVDAANGPGTDFLDVQPAVDASVDGDVILVRARIGVRYGPVVIDGRSLTVVGDPDASVPGPFPNPATNAELESLTLQGLQADGFVSIRGLTVRAPTAPALFVTDCEGAVSLDRCVFQIAGPFTPGALVLPTAFVSGSRSVAVVGTTIEGQHGFTGFAGSGATVQGADVHLLDSWVVGGLGLPAGVPAPGGLQQAGPGSLGLLVAGGSVRASGTFVQGGNGGPGAVDPADPLGVCLPPGDGGLALRMFDGSAPTSVELLDTSVHGGGARGRPRHRRGLHAGRRRTRPRLRLGHADEGPLQARTPPDRSAHRP